MKLIKFKYYNHFDSNPGVFAGFIRNKIAPYWDEYNKNIFNNDYTNLKNDNNDLKFYEIAYNYSKKITDKLTLSTDIINLINSKKMKLIITSPGDALQMDFMFWVIEYINKFNLDSKQVILVTSNLRGSETYKLLLEEFPSFKKYPMKHVGIDSFHYENFNNFFGKTDELVHLYPDTNKKLYKYLCYNGAAKEQRLFLVTELFRRGLDKYGLISLLFRYGNTNQISDDFIKRLGFNHENWELGKMIDEYAKLEMINKVPIVVDRDLESINENDRHVNIQNIKDTYFSIVTESYYYNTYLPISHKKILCLTEKTWKAILYHPFIMLGGYGTLKYLKSLGFETFPELFDESYDDIEDHQLRLLSVINSIEKVCSMDEVKFHKIYCNEIIPKVIHNRELAISGKLKSHFSNNFFRELLNES